MKITKQCPECGSTKIFKCKSAGTGVSGFDLLPGIGGLMWGQASFDIYVCGECGFYRMFVGDKWLKDIQEVYEPDF